MEADASTATLLRLCLELSRQGKSSERLRGVEAELASRDDCVPAICKAVEASTRGQTPLAQRAQSLLDVSFLAAQRCTDTDSAEFRRLAGAHATLLASFTSPSPRSRR